MPRRIVIIWLGLSAAALLAGCSGAAPAVTPSRSETAPSGAAGARPVAGRDVAVVSDRDGPSWSGRLGETVQVDWYDQTSGETHGERIAVLAVRRIPDPAHEGAPNEFGDDYGPYEWLYGIKVRLTSLDDAAARTPVAYQFLELSAGARRHTGIFGLGTRRGPDPSRVGRSSVGWLYQRTEEGFVPTAVVMPVGPWLVRWSLE